MIIILICFSFTLKVWVRIQFLIPRPPWRVVWSNYKIKDPVSIKPYILSRKWLPSLILYSLILYSPLSYLLFIYPTLYFSYSLFFPSLRCFKKFLNSQFHHFNFPYPKFASSNSSIANSQLGRDRHKSRDWEHFMVRFTSPALGWP